MVRQSLSLKELRAKYAALRELEEASDQERLDSVEIFHTLFAIPSSPNLSQRIDPMVELRHSVVVRLLRRASKDGDIEACKMLLLDWLGALGVDLPEGVLAKSPKLGRPGRPRDLRTTRIYEHWLKMGEPSLSRNLLAKAFFRKTFSEAEPLKKKRLVDLCRRAVERSIDREIRELKRQYKELVGQNQELTRQRQEYEKALAQRSEVAERLRGETKSRS